MDTESAGGLALLFGLLGAYFFFICAVAALIIASMWKVFVKAGKPGWAAIIPIYNYLIILEIIGKPWWWLLLLMIPLANIVIAIILFIDLAKSFGKSAGFGIGLVFLGIIFFPILGFGDARYIGPVTRPATPAF